jgi:hypothetical protein
MLSSFFRKLLNLKMLNRSSGGAAIKPRRPRLLVRLGLEHLEDRRTPSSTILGGVDLGQLPDHLFLFANGSQDANWQSASKGFVGDVAVNGQVAKERTSGTIAYSGTIFTNDSNLGAWQKIVNDNPGQAAASFGNTALISDLTSQLNAAFDQINGLAVTPGFANRSSTSLDGLNTENGIAETIVINVASGFQVSSKIDVTGDASDVFVLRWDTDSDFANGYQGQVKFQSGGAIVPHGGLTAGNFIHVAGNINASGGGSNPSAPYPQGPRLDEGAGALINGGKDFSGGGFFTGYWLTTGDPTSGDTSSLSNAIFVGGWYTLTDKFSMTSGTSGVHVSPNPAATQPDNPPASISGYVIGIDATTGARAGIEEVIITLYDGNGVQVAQTSTYPNGFYSFIGLAAGTYTIIETQPVGWLEAGETIGSLGGESETDLFTVTLLAGDNGIDYNFYEVIDDSTNS